MFARGPEGGHNSLEPVGAMEGRETIHEVRAVSWFETFATLPKHPAELGPSPLSKLAPN